MKLDRKNLICAVLLAFVAMGCGSRLAVTPPQVPGEPPAVTTELMAAELTVAEEAPRVGKAQRFEQATPDAATDDTTLKVPSRRGDHRRSGGFSGYK